MLVEKEIRDLANEKEYVKTNKLRVSDIWAFWDYMIRKYCSKNNRTTKDKAFLFTLNYAFHSYFTPM